MEPIRQLPPFPTYTPTEGIPSGLAPNESPRKKQRRNKPTLSCRECVDRKTKVRDLFNYSTLLLLYTVIIINWLMLCNVKPAWTLYLMHHALDI